MADKRVVVYDTTLNVPDELTATDRASFPGGFVNAGADGEMGSQKLTGLADGTLATDAVNLGQLDSAVIAGGNVKEALLHEDQIDNAEGFLGAIALVMSAQPVSGDLITTDDGVTTRSYAAVAGGDVTYALGGTAALTMQNFVDAVNGDGSATVTASLTTDLLGIAPTVVVLTEKDNDGGAHEIYGVWATQADIDVVDFTGELDYTKKTLTDMPAASPAGTNFGVRRTQAALTDGEMHFVLNNDVIYSWDDAANVWNVMSGSASIPDATGGSGGATKGKLTIDTDNGLSIAAGILSANIDAVTIDFGGGGAMEVTGLPNLFEVNGTPVGASVTAANLDTLTDGSNADALHVHAGAVAVEAPKIENTYVAQALVAAGDPVHFAANDEVAPSDAATLTGVGAHVMGVARTGAAATNPIEVVTVGPCAGVLAGAAFGDDYFLENGTGLTNGTPTGSGKRRLWKVGYAINATDLFVEIQDLGIRTIP